MKKALTALLTFAILFSTFAMLPASNAEAKSELGAIKWIVAGMTVESTIETSPAVLEIKRGTKKLSSEDNVASGDTVVTANGEYTAWVLGDVAENGEADTYAYILIKRHCLKTYELDEQELFCADVNQSGAVDSYDYILIKRICLKTYSLPQPKNSDGVPVFLYHHILTEAERNTDQWRNNDITITTSEFERHLKMIRDGGYNIVTANELVAYVRGEILLPEKSIMLCFDDGYKSNTYYAAPLLKQYGYKATVFSIMTFFDTAYQSRYDATSLQHITRTDLAAYSDVLDQQCHTWANHNELSKQSYNQIYSDLMLSQNCEKYEYFAYPYGDYDEEVIRAVKDAGFSAAFTTERRNAVPGDAIYEIPRWTITSPMSDNEYKKFLAYAD